MCDSQYNVEYIYDIRRKAKIIEAAAVSYPSNL